MTWEFRIFVPIALATYLCSVLDQILNASASSSARSGQMSLGQMLINALLKKDPKRTDLYILPKGVPASCGIKLRGGNRTEVKLCKGVSDYSMENWEKTTRSYNMGSKKWDSDMSSFLLKNNVPADVPLEVTHVVSMAKTREKLSIQDALVTVDVLRCSVSEGCDVPSPPPRRRSPQTCSENDASTRSTWLSLSLEGDEEAVKAAVQALALTDLDETYVYGGYPSFAAFLQRHFLKEKNNKTSGSGASSSSSPPSPKRQKTSRK